MGPTCRGSTSEADLTEADLSGANLSGSNLLWAILNRAELSNADFSCALCGATSLTTVDLSQVIGLGTVKHQFPSGVGIDTLITSVRNAGDRLPQVVAFLRGAGVPQELLDVLPAAVKEIKHYSCFIMVSPTAVRWRLTDDLRAENIRCWLWQTDKRWGVASGAKSSRNWKNTSGWCCALSTHSSGGFKRKLTSR